jgi:hypothetical protein
LRDSRAAPELRDAGRFGGHGQRRVDRQRQATSALALLHFKLQLNK